MTNKTGDDEGEEETEGEEIYQNAIGEEGRTEENSGIEENGNIRKKVEGSDTVGNLEFSRRMKPAVSEENLEERKAEVEKRKLQKVILEES